MTTRLTLPLALAIALLSASAPVAAKTAVAVEVVSPAAGAVLRAGGRMAVEWRLAPGAAPAFEEWEAFLSLDGGASWSFRLTPHLDRARSRFEIELPPVPARRALLMLRFGDEREEAELAAPVELAILPAQGPLVAPLARPAAASGEAARPGAAGVIGWVDGPRDGSRTVRWEARAAGVGSAPALRAATVGETSACPDDPVPQVAPAASGFAALDPEDPLSIRSAGALLRAVGAADRLALLSRRNE